MLAHGATACRSHRGSDDAAPARAAVTTAAIVPASSASPLPRALPPLGNAEWIERLDLGGDDAAYVTVPLGATEPRPIVVGVHGAGDRPEWACGGWRLATKAYPFVVCPRGVKADAQRYAWASSAMIERVVLAAVAAVRARFDRYVAEGPMIYAGFSQGAILAPSFLLTHAADYPVSVFAEGAYETTANAGFAARYRAAGGQRVMLVCGGQGCLANARRSKAVLERAGLEVVITGDPRAGHNLNTQMQTALARDWGALVAGDARWAGLSGMP
jgi:predicted esterase